MTNDWQEGYDCGLEEGLSRMAKHVLENAGLDAWSIARVQMAVERFMGQQDYEI